MMGCKFSSDTSSVHEDHTNDVVQWHKTGVDNQYIVREFVRYDIRINKLEENCAGPRMATIEAWLEHLQAIRERLLGMEATQPIAAQSLQQDQSMSNPMTAYSPPPTPQSAFGPRQNAVLPIGGIRTGASAAVGAVINHNITSASGPTRDLANLALSLGVVNNEEKASAHEDFFANLSETALKLTSSRYYTEIIEHTKGRLKTLTDNYAELNQLYLNHDGIIAFISGGTYMSRLEEKFDSDLETARDIRNKLGSALEQWRICGMLLRACSNAATQSLQQWQKLTTISNPKDKIRAALDCRNTLQAAIVSLDCAQLSLPQVEIQHISNRQILAVKHCNTYMITDIANKARYEHTLRVFSIFESNMAKACMWLYETFNKSLRIDFNKAEDAVTTIAKSLRDHREQMFTEARNK